MDKLTQEEWNNYLKQVFPDEILGFKRPTEGIPTDLDFSTNFPQFISKDPAYYLKLNAFLMQLFSNDAQCKKWIDELIQALNKQDFNVATQKLKGLMSAVDKIKLDGIASGAEVNQSAVSKIKVGDKTISTTEKSDTVEFVAGNNIALTVKDKILTVGISGVENGAEVNQNSFSVVQVGTDKINSTAKTDTLQIAAGKNISITTDTKTKKISIAVDGELGSIPVGHEYTIPYTELQPGQLALLGGKYLKSTFEDLWKWVQTHPSLIKTETEWQAISTASGGRAVPFYANVDEQYFRVPLVTTWVRGASRIDEVGSYLEAGLPNIEGTLWTDSLGSTTTYLSGAFYGYENKGSNQGFSNSGNGGKLKFSAQKSNPIYGKSTTVQPQSVCRLWVVQAFGTLSNAGNMDVTQVAQGVTDLTSRVSTLEVDSGFTIIYPNGGTKETPANVAVNSRYVMDNPFVGYEVECRAEVLYNGKWGDPGWYSDHSADVGVIAMQFDGGIIIQTALSGVLQYSSSSGNGFGIPITTTTIATTLPCRVKIWKIGKQVTA